MTGWKDTHGIYDRVEFKYNRQGQVIWKKDQNGTIHEYDYDDRGRQIADRVTSVGTGVDDAVLRISKSHEVRGMVDAITSYSTAASGSSSSSSSGPDIVNQVVFEYSDVSLLDKEYQEHSSAKDANTPYVGYNYDSSASGGRFTKGLRPTELRYPNGRLVHKTYGSPGSIADAINRIAAIKADSGGSPGNALAEYAYLGQGAVVQVDYPEPDLRYDLAHGAGDDPYDGMDRFGRVTDLLWRDYGSSTDAVRIQHGYDRAGNRLYRENPVAAANGEDFDELYTYDGVNQLKTFQRGNLNATKDGLVAGSMTFAHDWTLDPTGNWSTFKEDSDGDSTWDLDQARTSNKVNEITDITETSGPSWATPVYNRAGNMTTIPKPSDPTAGYTATNPDRQFVWGLRYIDDLILRDRDTSDPKNGTLDERLYAQQDPNWNVASLASTDGTIQERYAYDPYGTPIFLIPTFTTRATSNVAWETLYAGYRYDNHTGVYHVRHRVYISNVGWLRRDPIGFSSRDLNLYRYVFNRPLGATDPPGLKCIVCDKPRARYHKTEIKGLDAAVVGEPYKDLAKFAQDYHNRPGSLSMFLGIPKWGKLLFAAVYAKYREDEKARAAFYLFFVDWDICCQRAGKDGKPQDECRLFVDETGSELLWFGWPDAPKKEFRPDTDITDKPYVKKAVLMQDAASKCDRRLIFAGAPNVAAVLKEFDDFPAFGTMSIVKQKLEIRDRDTNEVVSRLTHRITLSINMLGKLDFFPKAG